MLLITLGDPGGAVRRRARAAARAHARDAPPARRRRSPTSRAIGLGFLLLEIALIQRFVLFLGFPTYALSVVLFALLVCTGAARRVLAAWTIRGAR